MSRALTLLVVLCAACASAPKLRPQLDPLAWMVGDWNCEVKSLDTGSLETAQLRFFPELEGAFIGGTMLVPGRDKKPLFELISHLGVDREGKWTRVDVDVSGRVKLLTASAAGDSTLWAPPTEEGAFRERIDRKGDSRWDSTIEVREDAKWTPAIALTCRRK
jgi:hypothetical protein